jgi:uncharacterized protein (DUF1778 family)
MYFFAKSANLIFLFFRLTMSSIVSIMYKQNWMKRRCFMNNLADKENSTARSSRLGFRATPRQQVLIRRAAEITHKSVTEFVLDSACEAAANALLDQRLFLVDDEAWQKFQDALDEPAKVKPKLQKLIKEKAPWE